MPLLGVLQASLNAAIQHQGPMSENDPVVEKLRVVLLPLLESCRQHSAVFKVTDFLLDRVPAVFARGYAAKTLIILLRLLMSMTEPRHRWFVC